MTTFREKSFWTHFPYPFSRFLTHLDGEGLLEKGREFKWGFYMSRHLPMELSQSRYIKLADPFRFELGVVLIMVIKYEIPVFVL